MPPASAVRPGSTPLRQAIEEERREYPESRLARGLTQAQIDEEDREAIEEAADKEQAVHAMRQGQKPLAAAEIDEFVHL